MVIPLPTPIALTPCLPTELLTFVLRQSCPTTIIICSTRNAFLSALIKKTSHPAPEPETAQSPAAEQANLPTTPSSDPAIAGDDAVESPPFTAKHPLLIPSLRQISRSRYTTMAFVPTVSHLRAYLAVLASAPALPAPPREQGQEHASTRDRTAVQSPFSLLLVYGLVELHRGTSEWSTQGLGNTLAGLVEAGVGTGRRVVMVEGREEVEEEEEVKEEEEEVKEEEEEAVVVVDGGGDVDSDEEEKAARAERMRQRRHEGVWHERLPILSGSVRRIGADAEYVGRTVEVGMVLRRWFKFGRGDWEDEGYA